MPDATTLTPDQEALLDEVLAGYLSAARSGAAPSRDDLLARHPELAGPLAEFFADQDRLTRLAAPFRSLRPAPALPAGARVGGYELLGELARGGMGVVYRARQLRPNRVVALKMLRAGPRAGADELRRFRAEAEAAARLDHPNIVPIYEVGEHDGQPFFSMKLVDGGHLGTRVPELLDSPRESAALLAAVARAVHYAHQRGVLHRDLKPANILLQMGNGEWGVGNEAGSFPTPHSPFPIPKITDFGLAKLLSADGSTPDGLGGLTQTGTALGTPAYMAPEQAAGGPAAATTAADVYSLGAILYELLTGRPPFRAETPLATLRRVTESEPERPRQVRAGVPRDLETVALKCLEKDPARRYPSAAELADDLERWLRGETIKARPVGPLGALERWARRQPVLAGLAAALAVAVVAGLAASTVLWRQAERHAAAAEERERESERLRTLAEQNWRESERLRELVEANFRLAHRAVGDFCNRFTEQQLNDDAARQGLGRELLDTALKYYQEFLAVRGDDPALLEEFADAHFRLASLKSMTGSRTEALAAFEKARSIYDDLIRRHPDRASLRSARAWILNRIGLVQADLGRQTDALASFRDARVALEELTARRPEDAELAHRIVSVLGHEGNAHRALGDRAAADDCYRRQGEQAERVQRLLPGNRVARLDQAVSLHNRAITAPDRAAAAELQRQALRIEEALVAERPGLRDTVIALAKSYWELAGDQVSAGRPEEAVRSARRGVELLENLAKNQPRATNVLSELAAGLRQLGIAQREADQLRPALASLQEAMRIDARLVEDHPDLPGYLNNAAKDHFDIGLLLMRNNQWSDAARAFEKACELRRKVVADDPALISYRVDLAMSHHNLGMAYWDLGRTEDAIESLRESAAVRADACRRAPQNEEYRRGAGRSSRLLADYLRAAGRSAEAAAALQDLLSLCPADPAELYAVARGLAQTARTAGAGQATLSDADRAERERVAGLALAALAEAVRHGFRDAARLRTDAAFAPLRDRDGFRQLLAELDRAKPPAP
jgi:serine/threonine-protein kinase